MKAVEQAEQRVKETELGKLRVKEAETTREEAMRMERAIVGRESEARTVRMEAERKRKEDIQPEVWPTAHELNAAKTRHQVSCISLLPELLDGKSSLFVVCAITTQALPLLGLLKPLE